MVGIAGREMTEMTEELWTNFRKAIISARKDSKPLFGFDTWRTVRISCAERVFDLAYD